MSLNTNKKMEGVFSLYKKKKRKKKEYMQNHQTQSYILNSKKLRSMEQQRNHVIIRNCGMEIEQLH